LPNKVGLNPTTHLLSRTVLIVFLEVIGLMKFLAVTIVCVVPVLALATLAPPEVENLKKSIQLLAFKASLAEDSFQPLMILTLPYDPLLSSSKSNLRFFRSSLNTFHSIYPTY
jgi:hypothetical protein